MRGRKFTKEQARFEAEFLRPADDAADRGDAPFFARQLAANDKYDEFTAEQTTKSKLGRIDRKEN